MSVERIQMPFDSADAAVIGRPVTRRRWARHDLPGRVLRAAFVAVVFAIVLPVLMIAAFDLHDPELYPSLRLPAFCMCP